MNLLKRYLKSLAILVCVFFTTSSKASHIVGGDIEYECIGPRTWKIKLTLYRDCTGVPLCNSMSCSIPVVARPNTTLNPPGCSATPNQVNFNLNLVKVSDVGQSNLTLCGNTAKNGCTNLGTVTPGSYTPSIELYVFEGTLNLNLPTLNATNTCPYWDVFWENCCRNNGILNLQNPGGTGFRIGATINIFWQSSTPCKNNSPVIKNEAVAVVCSGQEYIFNMGAVDPDQNDSLTYEIAPSKNQGGANVNYQPPFSSNYPFPLNSTSVPHINFPQPNGPFIIIDSVNGDISFNPINNTPNFIFGNLNIIIKQWNYNANGVPIIVGITQRDLQIYVISCPNNNPPRLATNPSLAFGRPKVNHIVCAGDNLCFTITAKDTDVYPNIPRFDTTFISWNQAIVRPGKLTFGPTYPIGPGLPRPREDVWQFCWQTEESDGNTLPYYFTVTATDNRCPNPGRIQRSFSIKVLPTPKASGQKTDLNCGRWVYTVWKTDIKQTISSARLDVSKEPYDWNFNSGATIRISSTPNPSGSGTAPRVMIRDTFTFKKGGRYLVKYTVSTPGAEPGQFCTKFYTDTLNVDTPITSFVRDTFVCKGNSISLIGEAKWGKPPYVYTWFRSNVNSTPVLGPLQTANVYNTPTENTTVNYFLRTRDITGCTSDDSLILQVKNLPLPNFSPDSARICFGQNFTLNSGNNSNNIRTYQWFKGSNSLPDTTQTISRTDSGLYIVLMTDTFGCQNRDTFNLKVNEPVIVSAGLDTSACPSDTIRLIATGAYKYKWDRIQSTTLQNIQSYGYRNWIDVSSNTTTDYVVTGYVSFPDTSKNYLECSNRDTVRVVVRPLPNLSITTPQNICRSQNEIILPFRSITPASQQGGTGLWTFHQSPNALQVNGSTTTLIVNNLPNLPNDTFFNGMTNVLNSNQVSRSYWIKYSYRGPQSAGACLREDSTLVRVYALPRVDAGRDTTRCINDPIYPLNSNPGHNYTPKDLTGKIGIWSISQGSGLITNNISASLTQYSFNPQLPGVNQSPSFNLLRYQYTINYNLPSSSTLTCTNIDSVRILVTPTPLINAGNDFTVCKNEPLFSISTKSGATTNSPLGSTKWTLAPGNSTDISSAILGGQQMNLQSPSVPSSGGTWRLIYSDSSTGCVVQDDVNMTVEPLPIVDIQYDSPQQNDSVCKTNTSINFRSISNPNLGTGFFSGIGVLPNGSFNIQDPLVTPQKWYTAYYQHTTPSGCSSRDSIITFVQEPANIDIATVAPKCANDTTPFNLSASVKPLFYGLNWSTDGSGAFLDTNSLITQYRFSESDASKQIVTIKATTANNGVCLSTSKSIQLNIDAQPNSNFKCDTCQGCVPYSSNFYSLGSGVSNSRYEWRIDNQVVNVTDSFVSKLFENWGSSVVSLKVTTPVGCSTISYDTVFAHSVPIARFYNSPLKTTIAKPFFSFYNTSFSPDGSDLSYVWNFGPDPIISGTNKPDRLINLENPQNIQFGDTISKSIPVILTVTSSKGCVDTAMTTLTIDPDITIFIPSAFRPLKGVNTSPCADMAFSDCNDVFRIYADGFLDIQIFIFNRWGQQVFSSNDVNLGWNGMINNRDEVCPQDVYIYQVNATSMSGKKYTYSGSVTLLR